MYSTDEARPEREKRTYICGLGARIECEPLSEHSTHSDRVTDIGQLLSLATEVKSEFYIFIDELTFF